MSDTSSTEGNGFEATDSGVMITGKGIDMYRLLSFRSMLGIEIKTGMKHSRGSILAAAQQQGLTSARTKKKAYFDINALIIAHGGTDRPLS